jgi:hypothetical protein
LRAQYSLQWLTGKNPVDLAIFPNNSDVAFKSLIKPKPAETLLHYNYGAAAVKLWGKNSAVLGNRAGLPRPQKPVAQSLRLTRTVRDRTKTIKKLTDARSKASRVQSATNGNGAGSATLADSEHSIQDEDNVMLFFWGNTRASIERHAERKCERDQSIHEWRERTVA